MKKLNLIILAVVAVIVIFMASTLVFDWIYPGSSFNSQGQTLHNVHIDNPQDPYGAARDIMSYTYHFTPHLIVSLSSEGAEAIFGDTIVDDIRANDGYFGYAGNDNVQGSMSRGDAIDTAMSQHIPNLLQIPVQILLGKITFHFV